MQRKVSVLTLRKLPKEHAATEMTTVWNLKGHQCCGLAAAEQKCHSCDFPPSGWRWQHKTTAAHYNISTKEGFMV